MSFATTKRGPQPFLCAIAARSALGEASFRKGRCLVFIVFFLTKDVERVLIHSSVDAYWWPEGGGPISRPLAPLSTVFPFWPSLCSHGGGWLWRLSGGGGEDARGRGPDAASPPGARTKYIAPVKVQREVAHAALWRQVTCRLFWNKGRLFMSEVRVVNHGLDTLVVNVYHTGGSGNKTKQELGSALRVQLEEWKRSAQEVGESVTTAYQLNGLTLLMQPNGALHGQFPWMLKTRDITLYVSTGSWNGIGAVRLSSEFLWSSQGVLHAILQVQEFVDAFFQDEMYLQASAVDLCVDIAGWQGIEKLDKKRDFVSRSLKRRGHAESEWGFDGDCGEYCYGLKETGLDFSHGGPLSLTIYDKSRELKKSGKQWFDDLWRAHGWSEEDERVWRVELRYKREVLHELSQEVEGQERFHGIEDVYVLQEQLPLLWAYGVGSVDSVADGLPGW